MKKFGQLTGEITERFPDYAYIKPIPQRPCPELAYISRNPPNEYPRDLIGPNFTNFDKVQAKVVDFVIYVDMIFDGDISNVEVWLQSNPYTIAEKNLKIYETKLVRRAFVDWIDIDELLSLALHDVLAQETQHA